ncbi:MAG: Mov34/MPN/PAD-1 family protein [Planctomycetota bacterium]
MERSTNKAAWIYQRVLKSLEEEASTKAPLETGGVLMGYFGQPGNTPVIMSATGPGPQAVHRQNSYIPDYEFDNSQIATIYEKYERRITYIGDWHTHPAPFPELSYRDKRTLRRIARCKTARVETPIMLLLTHDDEWEATIWQARLYKKYGWGKRLVISNLTLEIY